MHQKKKNAKTKQLISDQTFTTLPVSQARLTAPSMPTGSGMASEEGATGRVVVGLALSAQPSNADGAPQLALTNGHL